MTQSVMDCHTWGFNADHIYHSTQVGNTAYMLYFSIMCSNNINNVFYSLLCENGINNLFGCIGLRSGKSYCILNKQYSREEYIATVKKIIEDMKRRGEWGEFFPPSFSPS